MIFLALTGCSSAALCGDGQEVVVVVPPVEPGPFGLPPKEKVSFPIVMIRDYKSNTGYKIPSNLDDAVSLLKKALGEEKYKEYILNFDINYCAMNPEIIMNYTIPMTNFFYFMALSWNIDSEKSPSSMIKTGYYYFFEELPLNKKILSIIATINHGYKNIDNKEYCGYYAPR